MSRPAAIGLRLERPEDTAEIRDVHRRAFGRGEEAGLVDAIRGVDAAVLSMVSAEPRGSGADAGTIVAHVLYTRVTVAGEAGDYTSLVGLAPVAVLPSYQGRGIGTMLIEASLEHLRDQGHAAVVVVGDPRYYGRFGFLPGNRWGLRWEGPGGNEVFMVAELTPGALAEIKGVVRFRPEFAGV
jgi:putative acetyltransferase